METASCRREVTTSVFSGSSSKDAKTLHVLFCFLNSVVLNKTKNINHISPCCDDVQLHRHGDVWVFGRTRRCRAPTWVWRSSSSLWQPEVVQQLLGLCSTDTLASSGRSLKKNYKSPNEDGEGFLSSWWWVTLVLFGFFAPWCSVPAAAIHQGKRKEKKKTSRLHLLSFTHQSPDALLHWLVHIFVGRHYRASVASTHTLTDSVSDTTCGREMKWHVTLRFRKTTTTPPPHFVLSSTADQMVPMLYQ